LHSDVVTAPSAYLREEVLRQLSIDNGDLSVQVVPNFVDTDHFRPALPDANEHLTALFGREAETTPVLVHVSNFRAVKRVPAVVDIFARVHAQRPAFLLLVGDGPERPQVEAELRARGLTDRARVLGSQDHFQTLLRACTVFLLPSTHESFGVAALEALSSGVPVVASRVGGVPDVVQHGRTGYLVDPDDLEGMASRAQELCSNPGLLARFKVQARLDAEERFKRDPIIERYEAIYRGQ
jgi:N-acetyl-alpha-D-glucosaminyl L-malate synthase BshA